MKMRDEVIGKLHDQISDVLDALFNMAASYGAQAFGLPIDQIIHDRKIVRRQVPKHIYVALEETKIDAHRIEIEQFAQLAAADDLFHLAHRDGVDERVVHHERKFVLLCDLDKFFGLTHGSRERLFQQYMFAGAEQILRYLEMSRYRRHYGHGFEGRIVDDCAIVGGRLRHGVTTRHAAETFFIQVTDPAKLRGLVLSEIPQQIRSPVTKADNA